jgi:predicted nuclease of predicted toxin-antitoxin system
MGPKFLIDECLTPDLATLARERGFFESAQVTWLGKAGWKDWELKRFILEQDWTFVTRNSADFRGPADQPGFQRPVCGRSSSRGSGMH